MNPRRGTPVHRPVPTLTVLLVSALGLGLLGACTEESATSPMADSEISLAAKSKGGGGKGGGKGGGGGGDTVLVKAVDPDTVTKDTTLDVAVLGENFERGSEVSWELAGEPTTAVKTNNTRFVKSTKLIANITVAKDAPEAAFDALVITPKGRRGIGIELLNVVEFFPSRDIFRDTQGDKITSDGRTDVPQGPAYVDGVCGVAANVGNFDDARLDPDASPIKGKEKSTCGNPRALRFVFDDPADGGAPKATRVDGIFMNIDGVQTVTSATEVERKGQFNLCNRLVFNPDDPSVGPNGSDRLLVRRESDGGTPADPSDDVWIVRTKTVDDDGDGVVDDLGFCVGDRRLYHMPFELRIEGLGP
ncbi:MAG: hypothetical protein ACE5HP_12930 [Gemmatimonadota bacterium]